MNWLKPVLDFIGKFRAFFAYLAGYFTGRKVQKLKDENAQLKAGAEHEQKKAKAVEEVRSKWNRLRLINHASQPVRDDKEDT